MEIEAVFFKKLLYVAERHKVLGTHGVKGEHVLHDVKCSLLVTVTIWFAHTYSFIQKTSSGAFFATIFDTLILRTSFLSFRPRRCPIQPIRIQSHAVLTPLSISIG